MTTLAFCCDLRGFRAFFGGCFIPPGVFFGGCETRLGKAAYGFFGGSASLAMHKH
jgi:hypothetical protein